jgi:hypothetical protein
MSRNMILDMNIVGCNNGVPDKLAADMHWNAADERYHEALRRLDVVLLTLAGIAEHANCRSWPFRSLVLWLLRRAEYRVRGLNALPPMRVECRVCGRDEGARLARTFRALAAVFRALAHHVLQRLRIARRSCLPGGRTASLRLGRLSVASRPFYADTS